MKAEQNDLVRDIRINADRINTSCSSGLSSRDLVDLEAIVLNWAKQIFEITKNKNEARINKKHLQYNINWSHLFNECLDPTYSIDGIDTKSTRQTKEEQTLFKSTFTNTTEREQEYSFKTERSTRSSVTVAIEKGICRGVELALKLKTPCEILEANAGFQNEISVYHIGENTTEEELTWGVDSTVRVPALCETVAELVILEDHHIRKFSIECQLSGRIIVTVTNLKDNNSLVTIIEGKIADIIRALPNCASLGFVVQNDTVIYITKGICKFKYGVEQKVRIKEYAVRRPF
ncbi:unnamed protein product [Dracunculus medinensis]|uniref:DUF1758 domain-containing protein n=1 Tax=Dracunculus medinensis TaxID=318479 RepID=A0A0N4UKQ7_DRAME|nr:unnamed protein product [Dracunculus medinensis]